MKFEIVYAENLSQIMKEQSALLIDIRTKEEYNREHWNNAISMPIDEVDDYQQIIPKDKLCIFYCTHGGSSMKLARYLGNRDFKTATVIGGYAAMRGYIKKYDKSI